MIVPEDNNYLNYDGNVKQTHNFDKSSLSGSIQVGGDGDSDIKSLNDQCMVSEKQNYGGNNQDAQSSISGSVHVGVFDDDTTV